MKKKKRLIFYSFSQEEQGFSPSLELRLGHRTCFDQQIISKHDASIAWKSAYALGFVFTVVALGTQPPREEA